MTKETEQYRIVRSDGQKEESTIELEEKFPIVDIEGVSFKDKFMKHNPKTPNETRVKRAIITAKRRDMRNFRRAAIVPSFYAKRGGELTFDYGEEGPAVGMTPEWWEETAKKFMPTKDSRLGNIIEYDVFLGTVIKNLVENENYSIKEAWRITCDSQLIASNLGPCKTKGKHARGRIFEHNAIRKIVKGYGDEGFIIIGNCVERENMLYAASIREINLPNTVYLRSVGWIVLDV